MSSSAIGCKRARPGLGTFVEVTVLGQPRRAEALVEAGFAAIRSVQESMSYHDAESELSRLNRSPVGRWVRVSPDLESVLRLSLRLEELSNGAFQVACADSLEAWGLLPPQGRRRPIARRVTPGALEVASGKARRTGPWHIDLGGIAKGHAVDRAIEAMQRLEPEVCALVNAGGDLRACGQEPFRVHLRSGTSSRPMLSEILLTQGAVATSSVRISLSHRGRVSAYLKTATARPLLRPRTVAVAARECRLADALTKIALLAAPARARRIASSLEAELLELP